MDGIDGYCISPDRLITDFWDREKWPWDIQRPSAFAVLQSLLMNLQPGYLRRQAAIDLQALAAQLGLREES